MVACKMWYTAKYEYQFNRLFQFWHCGMILIAGNSREGQGLYGGTGQNTILFIIVWK